MTADAPVATSGFRLQRHVDALQSVTSLYAADKKRKATVATGLTIEYALHTTDDAKQDVAEADEERVVLIMGFGQAKESWAMTVDQLLQTWASPRGKRLALLSFDNRGAGATDATWGRYTTSQMADDALALMDHVGWPRAHVLGISMGGMIALELAAHAPARVRSLSLLVTTRGKYVNDQDNGEMRKSLFSKDPDVVVSSLLAMLYPDAFLARKMQDTDRTIREELYAFHSARLAVAPKKYLRGVIGQVLAIRTHFVSDERLAVIGRAGFPVLILGGKQDKLIPGSESQVIADGMNAPERVKLIIYEDAGHGLFTQHIDDVVHEYLANFQRASL